MGSRDEGSIRAVPELHKVGVDELAREPSRRPRFSIKEQAARIGRLQRTPSARAEHLELVPRTAASEHDPAGEEGRSTVHAIRRRSDQEDRVSQEEIDWARAADDRETAASEREQAARELKIAALLRAAAARDRVEAERERQLAGIDELTGVSLRSTGLAELRRKIHRAHRSGLPLVLVFVDVNNLKAVNDTEGHLAGDALLRRIAAALRVKHRASDVIVRYGGDEFVYAIPNTTAEKARGRLEEIVATLEACGLARPISFGLAELAEGDDLEGLLRRADEALIEGRRTSGHRLGALDAA